MPLMARDLRAAWEYYSVTQRNVSAGQALQEFEDFMVRVESQARGES